MQLSIILKKLKPFQKKRKIVTENQSTNDIINGIIDTHYNYFSEYDKIYHYFSGESIEDIAENIFNFLKKNVSYKIENENFQKLKSPAAILATSGDCKSYSLFIAGIIAAFVRNEGEDIPFVFRFAGYNNEDVEHVFVVLYPDSENEIWIDPVLNFFNERKVPYFYTDKKVKPMALYSISGVSNSCGCENSSVGGLFEDIAGSGILSDIFDLFDNSTNKWKSRRKKLLGKSPDERIAVLTNLMRTENKLYPAVDYTDWFSGRSMSHFYSDDLGKVQDSLVQLYNKEIDRVADSYPFEEQELIRLRGVNRNWLYYGGNKNIKGLNAMQQSSGSGNSYNDGYQPEPQGGSNILPIGLGLGALWFLLK